MTNLEKSIEFLTNSLKDESDKRLHDALAIMLNVYNDRRECECGNRHDRECYHCEELLCDDCDRGTIRDECSMCPSCKDEQMNPYYR